MALWLVTVLISFQRKFVRLSTNDKEASYSTFRDWLGSTMVSEEMWSDVMDEDDCFDYTNKGVGRDVASEVEVITDVGGDDDVGDHECDLQEA